MTTITDRREPMQDYVPFSTIPAGTFIEGIDRNIYYKLDNDDVVEFSIGSGTTSTPAPSDLFRLLTVEVTVDDFVPTP